MGCGSSKPTREQARPPQQMAQHSATASTSPTPVPPTSGAPSVSHVAASPEGSSQRPAQVTAQNKSKKPSPKPKAPKKEKKPRGDKKAASKKGKSPSAGLPGASSNPSDRTTRTASTSAIPNTSSPAGPSHPPAGPSRLPAGPQPVSKAGPVQVTRQETRPQFPPNLQSLLSNEFRFRILVVGRRGSGKSSLINAVFNVDMSGAPKNVPGRTVDFRPRDNQYLIVHECSGSGPGDFQAIRDFVTTYTQKNRPASERLHAIWICIPVSDVMNGQFDESVKVLLGFKVPIVVVFTMFDIIVPNIAPRNDNDGALAAASTKCEEFRRTRFGNVRAEIASTQPKFRNLIEQLVKTTDEVIIAPLRDISVSSESQRTQSRINPVALAWSVSQRTSRDIKIQAAIEVGRSRYWNGLASSDDFAGRTLASCVEVIHADIVGVWNFPDKDRYLSSSAFKDLIYGLVQDLSTSPKSQPNNTSGTAEWLSNRYENSNDNICLVVGYIIDLTLILCGVFSSPGNVLINKVQSVKNKFASSSLKKNIHAEIRRFIETVPKFKYHENDIVVAKIADMIAQNCDLLPDI